MTGNPAEFANSPGLQIQDYSLLLRSVLMEPTIIEKRQMMLLGFSFFGDPFKISGGWTEENEIGRLWKRFMAYFAEHRHRIQHVVTDAVMYEVHIEHAETAQTGEYEVFVGLEVEKLEDVPVEMAVKILPPTTYAVFTLEGEQITSDWHMMIYEDDQVGVRESLPLRFSAL